MSATRARAMSEDSDIGEGVCTKAPEARGAFSASKDIFTNLGWQSSSNILCKPRQDISMLGTSPAFPSVVRPQVTKQAPSKLADLQVPALSRESHTLGNSPNIKEIRAHRSLETRLSFSMDDIPIEDIVESQGDSAGEMGVRVGARPSRDSEALMELLDVRVAELSQKLTCFLVDMIDSRVEARLAALESQATQRASTDYEVAKTMEEELCAMGSQMQILNNRISKMTSRQPVRIEHVTALDQRLIALDRSVSELRCEYLEGCLRSHQMEELLIALHGNVREMRVAQSESKQSGNATNAIEFLGEYSSKKHNSGSSHQLFGGACLEPLNGQQTRLETISEVPQDGTSEGVPGQLAEETFVRESCCEGGNTDSPETVVADPCHSLLAKLDSTNVLETISEVPQDGTSEGVPGQLAEETFVGEGCWEGGNTDSPETVVADPCHSSLAKLDSTSVPSDSSDKPREDQVAPELAIEPHTPDNMFPVST